MTDSGGGFNLKISSSNYHNNVFVMRSSSILFFCLTEGLLNLDHKYLKCI